MKGTEVLMAGFGGQGMLLAGVGDGGSAGHQQRVLQQEGRIQQHAHRHEEQQAEDVPQGDDVAQGLMPEVRLAEDHSGDEGAEGAERLAELDGIPGLAGAVADFAVDGKGLFLHLPRPLELWRSPDA